MKQWIFYAFIFTVATFTFPLFSGDGEKSGRGMVVGIGVMFVFIVIYLIQLGWTKLFGNLKPKLVDQQDAAFASPISVRLEPISQPVPSTVIHTHSPLLTERDAAINATDVKASTLPSPSHYVVMDEDAIYTIVAEELESGKTDKGLWTRLYAEAGGDEKQTKVLYISRRAEKLLAVEKTRQQLLQNQETARLEQETMRAALAASARKHI
jgi:hypothetical protein